MSWLASQSSFLLTYETLVYMVYFVLFSQVSPMQFHLYTMILQFPPCLLKNQKQLREDLIWAVVTAQGQMKSFLENSHEQSLTVLGIAGMLDSDFLDSVMHSFVWPVCLPYVGVDLIFSIVLVHLYTFGCSVLFSCIIQ